MQGTVKHTVGNRVVFDKQPATDKDKEKSVHKVAIVHVQEGTLHNYGDLNCFMLILTSEKQVIITHFDGSVEIINGNCYFGKVNCVHMCSSEFRPQENLKI